MLKTAKIYVAGHRGLVGSAILRKLHAEGYENLIYKTSSELDLTNQSNVNEFFAREKPAYVFLAAAKVGGIIANRDAPVEFLYQNMMIEMNVLRAAAESEVQKLLLLGSSCIYPKLAPQPLKEEYLLTGPLEETNEAYALAKISGLKLAEYFYRTKGKKFISVMPSNIYGPFDNFHPEHSHVIPGLIRRFHLAKLNNAAEIEIWGTGAPLREFTHVSDLAEGCVFLMNQYDSPEFLNLGTGEEVSIRALANMIKEVTGFKGAVKFDSSKPDGTPRKIMDNSKISALGWAPKFKLRAGLENTYQWYIQNHSSARG
jgi:GDP-L-fucose synthase